MRHGRHYRVRSGDSLSSIAKSQLGHARLWPRIYAYNNRKDVVAITGRALVNPDKIHIGQALLMPPPDMINGRVSHAADHRHPRQTKFPHIAQQTQPVSPPAPAVPTPPSHTSSSHPASHHAPSSTAPSAKTQPRPSTVTPIGNGGGTQLNSFPFKYKLDLIPQQTIDGPNFIATLKFEGQIVIWIDKQIPSAAVTNKGLEATAHLQSDSALVQLVQDEKISWDPKTNKATLENMMTINAHGAAPSLTSIGIAIDSTNPIPALRFKFTAPKLQGKIGQHLYIAENVVMTLDLRPKPNDDDISRRPSPVRVGAPSPVPQRLPVPATEEAPWWARAGQWVVDHKVQIGVAVVVTAVVASNFLTAGADAEADPLVGAWAARTLQGAAALAH